MKVTKKTEGSITIKGKAFVKGVTVNVTDAVGKYIKDTFGDSFTFEEVKKAAPKREILKKINKDNYGTQTIK